MLLDVCNAAHDACAKLVSAKTEDGSLDKMSSAEFVSLCQGVESFSLKCEKVRQKLTLHLTIAAASFA